VRLLLRRGFEPGLDRQDALLRAHPSLRHPPDPTPLGTPVTTLLAGLCPIPSGSRSCSQLLVTERSLPCETTATPATPELLQLLNLWEYLPTSWRKYSEAGPLRIPRQLSLQPRRSNPRQRPRQPAPRHPPSLRSLPLPHSPQSRTSCARKVVSEASRPSPSKP
jgi:hypothetical protein